MKRAALFSTAGLIVGLGIGVQFVNAQTSGDTVTMQCPAGQLQAGQEVTCRVTAIDSGSTTTTAPSATTSTTSTSLPTTSTTSSTTTSTTSSPTTTAPPAGVAFSEAFSGPLATSRFTASHFRVQEDSEPNPTLNGSKVLVENGTLRIESGEQNYGDSAVRINQPFDFAGRTGTINLDATLKQVDGWTRVTLSALPYSLVSYRGDNAAGQGPDRGIDFQFKNFGGCANVVLRTYANGVQTDLDGPQLPSPCVPTSDTALTHLTFTVSNTAVTVKSGATTIGSWTGLNLGFTRGWLYLDAHNHATIKYANQPTWITHWDNVSFDGPTLPALNVAAESSYGSGSFNVPAGLTNPRLVLNAQHPLQDNPTLSYKLNGGPSHNVVLTRQSGQIGWYALVVPVAPTELVTGTNQVVWTWTNVTNFPPTRTVNQQLVWDGSGGPPPPTTTTTTTPATTTSPPTTTAPSSTTTTPASTTTAAPPTTTTPAGTFSEDFASPTAFTSRFDHGWSGEVAAGMLNGDRRNDWNGDHDTMCADPNATHRTIHVSPPANEPGAPAGSVKDVEQAFYHCVPGGDPAKAHVMTSVNTSGYVIAWFSPKQVFSGVHKVCWDQNLTDEGGGRWTQVVFVTTAEAGSNPDLGFTSPEFPNNGGPSTPRGTANFGVKMFRGGLETWQNGAFASSIAGPNTTDKAARFQHCVTDNENGTVAVTIAKPGGGTVAGNVTGSIPNGPIRVVFEDDNYNPDKHFDAAGVAPNSSGLYTWHWDNVQITASG